MHTIPVYYNSITKYCNTWPWPLGIFSVLFQQKLKTKPLRKGEKIYDMSAVVSVIHALQGNFQFK